jgi:hypothetical protein
MSDLSDFAKLLEKPLLLTRGECRAICDAEDAGDNEAIERILNDAELRVEVTNAST